jgi:hypothetical protein
MRPACCTARRRPAARALSQHRLRRPHALCPATRSALRQHDARSRAACAGIAGRRSDCHLGGVPRLNALHSFNQRASLWPFPRGQRVFTDGNAVFRVQRHRSPRACLRYGCRGPPAARNLTCARYAFCLRSLRRRVPHPAAPATRTTRRPACCSLSCPATASPRAASSSRQSRRCPRAVSWAMVLRLGPSPRARSARCVPAL